MRIRLEKGIERYFQEAGYVKRKIVEVAVLVHWYSTEARDEERVGRFSLKI
jgi:hypothetical protein